MQPYMTLSADVLIVGGGSAGVMAAIRAKQMDPGQRVVVFEKGDMQYSGCIARGMDAMNIVAVPGTEETPELYVENQQGSLPGHHGRARQLCHGQTDLGRHERAHGLGGLLPRG